MSTTTTSSSWCPTNTTSLMSSLAQLPNDLFMNKELFLHFFSDCDSVWDQLSEDKRHQLMDNYLPKELSSDEKQKTIELLMSGSLNRFSFDSLSDVFINLKLQKMSPDLVKALEDVKLLRKKLFKIYEQKRQSLLLKDVLNKRKLLFNQSIHSNDDNLIKCKPINKNSLLSQSSSLKERVKLRYRKELKDIRNKFDTSSEEEDSTRSTDKSMTSKLNGSHLFSDKQYNEMLRKHKRKRKAKEDNSLYDPTLETNNITLSDIIMRVTNSTINYTNNINSTKQISNSLSQNFNNNSFKSSSISTPKKKAKHSNVNKTNPLIVPKSQSPTIKLEKDINNDSELSNKSDSNSNQNTSEVRNESNKRNDSSTNKLIPSLIKTSSSFTPPVISQSDSSIIAAPLPALPLLLPSTPDPPSVPSVPLEKAPKCFFSLLRDVFNTNASIDQRLTLHKLEELVKEKLRSFSPYIGWSTEMVASAMNYLSGVLPPPHLVPLVDYKEKNQQWQWIGGGRDLDSDLVPLCEEWMKSKDEDPTTSLISFSQSIPPPAKCQTDWIVRPSSDEEKVLYRKQEAIRYHNPYKAFTYRVHGYESVVGPVKGCGIGAANGHNSSSPNKAREHSLLVSDRPPFVTLLSLVRDAAARLPNGEGTRADICELLKDSQYLLPTISDQQVNGIVSGALDRLHYEKDPCVKYDVNRKVWIYLHRNRTEAEFERLHEVQIAAAKAKRSMNKASRKTNCVNNPTNALSQTGQLSIISKTTQQAIHQAVTNILNSEALKIPSKPISIDNSEKAVSSSSLESVNTTKSVTQDLKTSLVNTITEKEMTFDSNSLSPFNGSSSTLSSGSLFLSLQGKNQIRCKSDVVNTSTNIPIISKKKTTKLKETKLTETLKSIAIADNKQNIIVSNSQTLNISQPTVTLSVAPNAVNSSEVTKLLVNDCNAVKFIGKPRTIRQTKPAIKVQIPKTITLPIPITQNTLKPQQSVTTNVVTESIPTLISVTNPLHKSTNPLTSSTTTLSTQQSRPLTTKIISGTQLNSTSGATTASNAMHQISIPTSVLFGTRPGSVVLGINCLYF